MHPRSERAAPDCGTNGRVHDWGPTCCLRSRGRDWRSTWRQVATERKSPCTECSKADSRGIRRSRVGLLALRKEAKNIVMLSRPGKKLLRDFIWEVGFLCVFTTQLFSSVFFCHVTHTNCLRAEGARKLKKMTVIRFLFENKSVRRCRHSSGRTTDDIKRCIT